MARIGVCLAGSGRFDGSEIHEAVLTLLSLCRAGAELICFAPNRDQLHVVNHLTGEVQEGETRNVLVEAARIARGELVALDEIHADDLDALVVPGGFGAAKNLCDFAVQGAECTIDPQLGELIRTLHAQGKPMGFICIAPAVAAAAFKGCDPSIELTIGSCEDTASALSSMGAKHAVHTVTEFHVDEAHNIVSTPAYMLGQNIAEVAEGIEGLVQEVVRRAEHS